MKNSKPAPKTTPPWLAIVLILAVLFVLFWRSFLPDYVHFSNDGPLGNQNSAWQKMPEGMTGMWIDLNFLGYNAGAGTLSISGLLHIILGPLGYSKFYPVVALFIVGLGAWAFFRQLKLSPLAAALGSLGAMLNSTFFSTACWGVASQEIGVGMTFFAMALVVGCNPQMTATVRWARFALAGMCVGMNVMEAADIGALNSMLAALFIFFHALTEGEGALWIKSIRGICRVTVVAAFALFIALQSVLSLVGIGIEGKAGAAQDAGTKLKQWDWATQWSLPKAETLGLVVPGLFGYKMDTPSGMLPELQPAYMNGLYWGGAGRDPNIDRYFDSGSQGKQPPGYMRFTGGGNYCGLLVVLVAAWGLAQAFRRKDSLFGDPQKRMIIFWGVIMVLCLLLAWGRFAPFYAIVYQLPYFSTIRNPAKFIIFFGTALVTVFAYGIHALDRRYLETSAPKPASLTDQFSNWWAKVSAFDRKWTYATAGLAIASLGGWLIYSGQKPDLIKYLQKVGFGDLDPTHEMSAPAIAGFSIGQAAWSAVLFCIALGLVLLVITGYFNGPRAKLGAVLLGAFLIFDMGRANLPWIIHWNYKQKYEVGSLNPIVETLRAKPWENRVAYAIPQPMETPPQFSAFTALYQIEWMQHHFPYYNIQSLDVVQNPRPPKDMVDYEQTFAIKIRQVGADQYQLEPESFPLTARKWQLTNTRYLLGPAGVADLLNQSFDPEQRRFRVAQRFDVLPRAGINNPYPVSDKEFANYIPTDQRTAVPNENGDYALIEFTGALPRAKLYSSWQVNTNDEATLHTLADAKFDPLKTVLVSTPEAGLANAVTNDSSGTVTYQSYSTKHIVFSAQNSSPSILLLNDQYDPHWKITVDGQPAELLRCNFIMRGVYLPTPGSHTVDFQFGLPHKPLYVTLSAIVLAMLLGAFLYVRREKPALAQP